MHGHVCMSVSYISGQSGGNISPSASPVRSPLRGPSPLTVGGQDISHSHSSTSIERVGVILSEPCFSYHICPMYHMVPEKGIKCIFDDF